jgi:hypothetical protein
VSALRVNILVFLAFVGLTAIVTYPQVLYLASSVPFHSDPYFSMWRLGWVAHQIVRDPQHLFEANIFFPAHHTLAYSDAMLLPGIVLAPLFWSGVNPVAIYNVVLLTAIALSGFTAFLLARRLTGSVAAGVVAGVIFAFAPYRFTHYMHLELQIVFWMPLALLLIHRIAETGRLRDGLLLGVVAAAQAFSTIYGAIFLATYCVVFVPLLLALAPPPSIKRVVLSLFVAGAFTAAVAAPYAAAYRRAEETVGSRSVEEVRRYSASLNNYFRAPQMNRLYGSTAITDPIWANEMNLFPGVVALALGALGLLAARRVRFAYLAALLFALDLSRGAGGVVYPQLYRYFPHFRGLRSPARIDILVNLSLAILGAYGVAWLLERTQRPIRQRTVIAVIIILLTIEYASLPDLAPAPPPSQVDTWLSRQPPVVIVELPLASRRAELDSRDWLYMYEGTRHEQRMLNGYSGFAPASYYAMLDVMETFPDDRSMAYLRERGVDYVIVRGGMYRENQWPAVRARIRARDDLSLVLMFAPESLAEGVYAIRK